jgi:serine/threonine protein kinase
VASSDDDLIELAGAILDGSPVDWPSTGSDSGVDSTVVSQLRVVAELANVHRRQPLTVDDAFNQPSLTLDLSSDLPRWGHLLLHERVGRGSFGEVYRAWDTRLDREVALKLIDAKSAPARQSLAIEEGRLLARVRHPNVVLVHGAEQIGSRIGIWTEFIHGRTLEQILCQEGPFSAADAAATGIEVSAALEAVHRAGLLHRDIKAQNVMREDGGRIVLMDLGAGVEHVVNEGSRAENLAGTPVYLAPEVLRSHRPTARSDVYGVGVLLFHLVSGSFPIAGQTLEEVREAHRANRRKSLAALRGDLPEAFVKTIERAIDPDPARRHDCAAVLSEALRSTLPDVSPKSDAVARHRPTAWLMAVGVASAIVAAIAVVDRGVLKTSSSGASRPPSQATGFAASIQPVMRKVTTPKMGLFTAGTPSFDGRLYSNTDRNEDVIVFDLSSGVAKQVTNKGDSDEVAEFSALSPDGRQVAYSWLTLKDVYELRISSVDDARSRVLVPRGRAELIVPVEWSRDGSQLLCLLHQPGGRFQIGLVTVASGNVRLVRDLGPIRPQHIALSTDNRFVAYDFPAQDPPAQRDIFIQPIDGSTPRPIVMHPADDVSPVWTPDGRHLFFLSNRSGTYDGWIVGVVDGVAEGDPTIVVRNVGQVSIAGFTSTGALYFWRQSGDMDVFTQSIEGGPTSRAERIASRFVGSNSGPAWSPDGRALAYISRRPPGGPTPQAAIVVHDLRGGQDREIPVSLQRVGPVPVRWSPDQRELLIRGSDSRGRAGVFVVQIEDGTILPGVVVPDAHMTDVGQARWWIDGRSIAYISPKGLVVRERGSDMERVVFDPASERPPLRLVSFEPSPDGQSLAISAVASGTEPPVRVLHVMTIGGAPFEVARATLPDQLFLQSWMPNGRELLFTRRDVRVSAPHALWRVSMNGAAHDTGVRIPGFTQVNLIQVDPSGQRIAYTADEMGWELWVMEHFLPEAAR